MISEIFLIDRSVLQFHYSSNKSTSDDDKAVLSSGFFSAIQDFSTHARSDVLDSFSTETEYFLYLRFPDSERVLVGVFDQKSPEGFAREAMEKIMAILLKVKFPDIEGMQLSGDEKDKIREEIEKINVQLFSNERLSSIVIETLKDRSDIPLAFLVDSTDSSLIASFSRPKPLFKQTQVREFLLVHTTLQKVFESLGNGQDYSYFVIESDDYAVVACNGGRLLSVASGAMRVPKENVYEAATTICYAENFEAEIVLTSTETTVGKLIFSTEGRVSEKDGRALSRNSIIFISSLIKNIESMFKILTRRSYKHFFARSSGMGTWGITLISTSGMTLFELHELQQ
ncbi:MAG: hypothetical protein ACXABX_01205 [Candidatus Thorarchaeota archaeon]|jgi:hypothetical protein